jgi:hypothetical protein
MDEALNIMQNPRMWPDWPYLQLERRTELRPDSPYCVLVADELHSVEPVVFFSDNWPPGEWFSPDVERAIAYQTLDEVRSNGWRPRFLLQ